MQIVSFVGAGILLALFCSPAMADTPDQDAVQVVLNTFVRNFNEGKVENVCDIFATDLIYDYRGLNPNRTYKEICTGLHATLADQTRHYHYAIDHREILVFGNIAVVRVVWDVVLTGQGIDKPIDTQEHSMDLFRRLRGGGWKLFRFNAFGTE